MCLMRISLRGIFWMLPWSELSFISATRGLLGSTLMPRDLGGREGGRERREGREGEREEGKGEREGRKKRGEEGGRMDGGGMEEGREER